MKISYEKLKRKMYKPTSHEKSDGLVRLSSLRAKVSCSNHPHPLFSFRDLNFGSFYSFYKQHNYTKNNAQLNSGPLAHCLCRGILPHNYFLHDKLYKMCLKLRQGQ